MPWTAKEFKDRHAKDLSPAQARKAASMANAMLKNGTDEGVAIATAIKRAKQSVGESLYPKKD
jgi:uncharacterized protein YdaT